MSVFSLYILVFDMFTVLCLHQLLPMITRNYLKEGYMEKTGPMVSSLKSLERHLHAYIILFYFDFYSHSPANLFVTTLCVISTSECVSVPLLDSDSHVRAARIFFLF